MRKNEYRKKSNDFVSSLPYIFIAIVLAAIVVIAINV